MIGALIVVLLAAAGGTVATYLFDDDAPGYARLATGTVVGLTILGFVALTAALAVGLGLAALAIAVAVSLAPAIALRGDVRARVAADLRVGRDRAAATAQRIVRDRRPSVADFVALLYVGGLALGAWAVADRNLFGTPDGLYITNVGNLGDLPFHTAITSGFAYGGNFPPQNPVFSGSSLAYHYMVDFLAAVFVAAGATLRDALLLVTLVLGGALLPLIHRWGRDLTGSVVAARLTLLLFLFSGGLGWILLFGQSRSLENGLVGAFFGSDARYTIQPNGIFQFQNTVTGLLVPQRGLLLGMGIAVIVLTLLWHQLDADPAPRPASPTGPASRLRAALRERRMIAAGLLTGVLPIIHIHTFGVVLGTAFLIGLAFRQWREGRWRAWLAYVVPALAVGLPVLFLTALGNASGLGSYVGVQLGWEAAAFDPIEFWLVNTGVFIPLLVVAYVWDWEPPLMSRKLLIYSLLFVTWFLVANVFRLAPWLWDNIKLLIFWWLGGVPVIALLLTRLWNGRLAARLGAVVLALVLMSAGALDVLRSTVGPSVYQEWDSNGIAFAAQVREGTPQDAVVLIDPTWNSPIFLTGRRVFMGYDGWLFANGLPWADRAQQAKAMYAGGADAMNLLRRFGVAFIVVGPGERRDMAPNESFLKQFPVAISVGDYQLYRVTP